MIWNEGTRLEVKRTEERNRRKECKRKGELTEEEMRENERTDEE
jgi:hypothetical protein